MAEKPSDVTSAEVGQDVAVIFDGTGHAPGLIVDPIVFSGSIHMDVKYVPTPGAADDA